MERNIELGRWRTPSLTHSHNLIHARTKIHMERARECVEEYHEICRGEEWHNQA